MPYPWQDVAFGFGARPVQQAQQAQVLKSLRLRPGKRLPFLDFPAREGLPEGLRLASLPKEAIALATTELNKSILSDRVLETVCSFLISWCVHAGKFIIMHVSSLHRSWA